ncbi:diguanylate cyclase/phosphodiesterase (GGDEF & EAL domains) with PAS/PAC sensor(s) [hydrothermal vent metagenome]|uniref:Diguanylate cyclase/phosphodiesterase (GGDEF & EAL domains) with PAS/PAC sensor(S) n=1 Tax=hydrothermal vent metagenome TaxID=652676 RepID=A0A3B0WPC3_9ZZZZ
MLLDLNNFKIVNDSEGHLKGDEILKLAGDALREAATSNDYTARWGGDEFIIILSNTNNNTKKKTINELRTKLKGIIDFEIGETHSQKNDTLDELVKRADEAMYKQKHNRRRTDST